MGSETAADIIFDHYLHYREHQAHAFGRTRGTMGAKAKALELVLNELGYRIKKVSGTTYEGAEYKLEGDRELRHLG